MTVMEIHGQDHTGDFLWVNLEGREVDVTPADLARARRSIQRGYSGRARIHGCWLDEEQVSLLIKAMDAPQALYPTVACKYCGTDASELIEDEPYCHGHAQGHTAREEGQ